MDALKQAEALTQAYGLLVKAAPLIEAGGWPGLAEEVAEMANAVDAAIVE